MTTTTKNKIEPTLPDDMDVCTSRNRFLNRYHTKEPQCNGCPHEVGDLFSGTGGLHFYGFYCGVDGGVCGDIRPLKNRPANGISDGHNGV